LKGEGSAESGRAFLVNGMHYITFSSETVVFGNDGRKIVAVPTEKEAIEFIEEQEEASMDIKRGDILFCSLGVPSGSSIQGGNRPVAVISNNVNNKFSTVFTAIPLTTRAKKNLPTHVDIKASENHGLREDSIALCEQIMVLSEDSILNKKYGRLNDSVMEQITEALQIQLGMCEGYNS